MYREFNDAEATLHRKFGEHARDAVVEAGLPITHDAPLVPAVLDELWGKWEWSRDMPEEDQNVAIALFGFALGDYIAAETGMNWGIALDEQGSDYALVLPGTEITAFPLARRGQTARPSVVLRVNRSGHDSRDQERSLRTEEAVVEGLVGTPPSVQAAVD